jgi:hypothetical protein
MSIHHLKCRAADDKRKILSPVNRSSIALTDQLVRPGPVNHRIFTCDFKKAERRLAAHWTYRYDHNN